MKSLFLFLSLSIFKCFGQDIAEINKNINWPDSLQFEKEIRVYKDYTILTSMQIFRMYDSGKDDWIVDVCYYNKSFKEATKINQIKFPKEKTGNLKPMDANLIWLNLLLTQVEYLPNIQQIDYKLSENIIEKEDGEYGISKIKKRPLDGFIYKVFVRNGKLNNHFEFDNPEVYLKNYPNVDELTSYNKLISVIEKEFHIFD